MSDHLTYDDIRPGDTVQCRGGPESAYPSRMCRIVILHECVSGWIGAHQTAGWQCTVTPKNFVRIYSRKPE